MTAKALPQSRQIQTGDEHARLPHHGIHADQEFAVPFCIHRKRDQLKHRAKGDVTNAESDDQRCNKEGVARHRKFAELNAGVIGSIPMTDHKKTDAWIESVYKSPDRESLRATYDKWAATYDADMVATGYVHYPVIIGLVCRHVLRKDAAILDAGVGTGAIGSLLNIMGYNNLSGIDMSEGMLERAAARKVYADLRKAVLGETLDFVDRSFDAIISLGRL